MNSTPASTPAHTRNIRIWQQNLNKSRTAQDIFIQSPTLHLQYDILLIQEPYLDKNGATKASSYWKVVYPDHHRINTQKTRTVILVNKSMNSNTWQEITIKGSGDLTGI